MVSRSDWGGSSLSKRAPKRRGQERGLKAAGKAPVPGHPQLPPVACPSLSLTRRPRRSPRLNRSAATEGRSAPSLRRFWPCSRDATCSRGQPTPCPAPRTPCAECPWERKHAAVQGRLSLRTRRCDDGKGQEGPGSGLHAPKGRPR